MIDAGVLVPRALLLPGPPRYVAAISQSVANFSILVQIVMSKQSLLPREQKIAAGHEQLRVPGSAAPGRDPGAVLNRQPELDRDLLLPGILFHLASHHVAL